MSGARGTTYRRCGHICHSGYYHTALVTGRSGAQWERGSWVWVGRESAPSLRNYSAGEKNSPFYALVGEMG